MSNKQAKIYDFIPAQLAQTETDMWRAYYDRRPWRLFRLSLQLLQEQLAFGLPVALLNGYRMTVAAFVFKRGKQREDYRKALHWLRAFYGSVQKRLSGKWNPHEVAELELEWWIVHRHDFGPNQTAALEKALSELCSMVYHVPEAELEDYAHHRAVAMLISDANNQARAKGLPEAPNWTGVQEELELSYAALNQRLNEVAR